MNIGCVVLAVYPAERQLMRDHAVATAPFCADFTYVISNSTYPHKSVGFPELETGHFYKVMNLAREYNLDEDVWTSKTAADVGGAASGEVAPD